MISSHCSLHVKVKTLSNLKLGVGMQFCSRVICSPGGAQHCNTYKQFQFTNRFPYTAQMAEWQERLSLEL